MPADEFKEMWRYLETDLPHSFRFTGSKADALEVRDILKSRYIPAIKPIQVDGQPVEPPEPVPFFLDELVWNVKAHKKVIRKYPPFKDFQQFLVAETASGNISRQEIVSMLPPIFLHVRPGMTVLDMCAAPGSKSAQLAEMIHGDEDERVRQVASGTSLEKLEGAGDYTDDGRSTGLLIANDADYKRSHMLVHQVKRLNFPNLIVTQHDASNYPSIKLPTTEDQPNRYLKFDRILADVPCSGDGTARKNPNVWGKWTPRDALGLHNLQLRILERGLQLLKIGGRLVYSTCSMHPVENEAVIAAAIKKCGGVSKVQLVDCSDEMPLLKRRPGLTSWKVFDMTTVQGKDKKAHFFSSFEKFEERKRIFEKEEPGRQFSNKIYPDMFPPPPVPDDERIPLERCMRIYPHLQNTGAFFIAVFEKKAELTPSKSEPNVRGSASKSNEGETNINLDDLSSPRKRPLEDDDGSAPPRKLRAGATDSDGDAITNGDHSPVDYQAAVNNAEGDAVEVAQEPAGSNDELQPEPSAEPESDKSDAESSKALESDGLSKKKIKREDASQEIVKRGKRGGKSQEEYFEYLPEDHSAIKQIFEFFSISDRFPRDRFMVKNEEGVAVNKIYYTSKLTKSIVATNKARGVKFVHCGVAMFVSHSIKGDLKCPWRLQAEGIRIIEPWVSARIVTCNSRSTLHKMLIEMFPIANKNGCLDLEEVGEQLENPDLVPGCCILKVEANGGELGFKFPIVLPLWRHPGSINVMVSKEERLALLLRLYNEKDPKIRNHITDAKKGGSA
ncbi:S-adenosyl-L-methionine-dependent methyltransferase [Zopfia rhizophila CBS 207.26]|uniref:S-adenosyl-L-methionine-dependent methyltransferase n=1 Tax=Zopfia rhizophila CBS 207.26 TaxID=1314779 RepID=A0A6A6EQD7_9PEZI|nr:S-adenosyl-L-methionine-dependent methyltransferase [Zopfia rhizophila CBS 207.26]